MPTKSDYMDDNWEPMYVDGKEFLAKEVYERGPIGPIGFIKFKPIVTPKPKKPKPGKKK